MGCSALVVSLYCHLTGTFTFYIHVNYIESSLVFVL